MNTLPPLAWTPSIPEMVIVLAVLILLFGAKKLPELSRSIGKSISEFKKGKEEAERELQEGRAEAEKSRDSSTKSD